VAEAAPPHALLYDVHGNLPALEAALADARSAGAERFVLGGDYALFGARPRETAARLRELDGVAIRGNTDRWLRDSSDAPDSPLVERSLAWCREALGDELCDELAAMPVTAPLNGALVCHASPRSDMLTFAPAPSDADTELLRDDDPAVVVFGHSHLQFERELGGRLLVNPGSVGLPFDGDRRAAYALWHGGRRFELRRVEYDVDSYVEDVREGMGATLGEAVETLVRRLERAAFVD
jgi:diadenosine tetraphosphatase ApaH/serine/threonine PP2A family protein phosphatase